MSVFDRLGYGLGRARGSYLRGLQEAAKGETAAKAGRLLASSREMEGWNLPDLGFAYNQQDLYQRLSWVAMAVLFVAEQAAGKRFDVKRMVGEDQEDIPNHPYELLHRRPNELWSGFEFWRAMIAYRKITGNGYAHLNRVNANTPPSEMWVIPSHQMLPVPDGRMSIKGYIYKPGGGVKDQPLERWEVLHLKGFNPMNKYVGLSDISQIAIVAEGDIAMQKHNRDYFKEGGGRVPGMVAFADPILDAEWEKIKEDFSEADKKRRLMMLRNVGKGGVEWVQTSLSQKDMEFLAGRKSNQTEIFNWIAPGLASWVSENATEATSRSGRDAFYELAVWPRLREIEEKLTNELLPSYGEDLQAVYEDVRPRDRQQQLQDQAAYERTHTLAEVRKKFYGDKPLGDERDDVIARVVSGEPAGIEGLEAPIDIGGREISQGKASGWLRQPLRSLPAANSTPSPAKRAEVDKFKRFAAARVKEGKAEKIGEFVFEALDEGEVTALKAEVLGGEWAVKAELQRLIEAVREES